jgi:hypothetical protein
MAAHCRSTVTAGRTSGPYAQHGLRAPEPALGAKGMTTGDDPLAHPRVRWCPLTATVESLQIRHSAFPSRCAVWAGDNADQPRQTLFVAQVTGIRYARTTDGLYIAYQVAGQGPPDLVATPSGIAAFVNHPRPARRSAPDVPIGARVDSSRSDVRCACYGAR